VSAKYLLPCRCGQQMVIEPRQAGETVVCRCGATLQVPRMLEIVVLEPAPAESGSPRSGAVWGWRQRIRLLGVMLLLVSIIAGACLYLNPPVSRFKVLPSEELQRKARKLTPSETWWEWQRMKQGLDRWIDQQHAAELVRYRIWQAVTGALAIVGIGLIAAGMAPIRARPGGRVAGGDQKGGVTP